MPHLLRLAVLATVVVFHISAAAGEREINIVASIKPVHSLVAAVTKGINHPYLLVKAAGSPHAYSLKPSDAEALERADIVFWINDQMETFLRESIDTLSKNARSVKLSDARDLKMFKFRADGPWVEHVDDEEHEYENETGIHGDGHVQHGIVEGYTGDESHLQHAHGEIDMHFWLDPDNAKVLVSEIVQALIAVDFENRAIYQTNGRKVKEHLEILAAEIDAKLAPFRSRPFVVFHDGYQYLEKKFGLNAVGSVTINADRQPGAARLKEIRSKIKKLGAVCVFSEPQFEPKLVAMLTEGTNARTAELDPLGADLPEGPELYFTMMQRNAYSLQKCLTDGN